MKATTEKILKKWSRISTFIGIVTALWIAFGYLHEIHDDYHDLKRFQKRYPADTLRTHKQIEILKDEKEILKEKIQILRGKQFRDSTYLYWTYHQVYHWWTTSRH